MAVEHGMSLFALMENAGNGLYRMIAPLLKRDENIVILAGKGNNGGDGIVLARYLKNNGFDAELVFPLGEPQTETAKKHFAYYQACGFDISPFATSIQADLVVDALLGVGSRLPLRNDVAKVTKWINQHSGRVVAIDLPTGVSADNGERDRFSVVADYTFCLHGYKPSAFLFPASENYGTTATVDIGIPQTSRWRVWTDTDVTKTLPKPTGNTHKGSFGTSLLIAGNDEMPGSAALAAIGALRFGAGKLEIATTKHASTIIGPLAPEATFTYELFEGNNSIFNNNYSCVGIGPGLNTDEYLEGMIDKILQVPCPIVLDAGALKKRRYPVREHATILTPHPGEFRRLIGKPTADIQQNRIQFASTYAVENRVTVVLKGKFTVIAFSDGSGFINPTGNRALSKGGTGDTLTGMLIASIGTHSVIKEAVANAVFLHGACADEWLLHNGEETMLAHDFHHLLPKVCKKYKEF